MSETIETETSLNPVPRLPTEIEPPAAVADAISGAVEVSEQVPLKAIPIPENSVPISPQADTEAGPVPTPQEHDLLEMGAQDAFEGDFGIDPFETPMAEGGLPGEGSQVGNETVIDLSEIARIIPNK